MRLSHRGLGYDYVSMALVAAHVIVLSMIVAVDVFVSVLDCFIFIFISCPCVKWYFVNRISVFCSYTFQ